MTTPIRPQRVLSPDEFRQQRQLRNPAPRDVTANIWPRSHILSPTAFDEQRDRDLLARAFLEHGQQPRASDFDVDDRQELPIPEAAPRDATAGIRPSSPETFDQQLRHLPQPTVKAALPGVRGIPPTPREREDFRRSLETPKRIGESDYPLQDVARDVIASRGAFSRETPGGTLLDFTGVPGAARGVVEARHLVQDGHPIAGITLAGLSLLPFGKSLRKLLGRGARAADIAEHFDRKAPERILVAASRSSDGRVFVGPTHGDAMLHAEEIAKQPLTWREQDQGFLTSHGRFVSRDEAYDIQRPMRAGEGAFDSDDFSFPAKEAMPVGEWTPPHTTSAVTSPQARRDPRFGRQEPRGTPVPSRAPIDEGRDPRLFNVAKYGFSPEGEQQFRAIAERLDLRKRRVSERATMAEAERRATDPDALIRAPGRWSGTDALAARLFQSQSSERLAILSRELQSGMKTAEERAAIQREIGRIADDVAILAGRSAKERSAAGRNLSTYRIVAKHTMDEPTWQSLAQRAKGELALASDEILKIRELTAKRDREGLVRFISSLHKSSSIDKALGLWKAGLLTGVGTHVINPASNAAEAVLETANQVPAIAVDRIISLVRGTQPTKAYPAGGLVISQLRAIGPGLREAKKVFKMGITPEEAAKWDFRRTNYESPFFQAYHDVVFNALAAEDRPFRMMAFQRSLGEQVKLRVNQMRRADPKLDVKAATKQLMQAPPDDLVVNAVADAELAVFQNRGSLATMASAAKGKLPSPLRAGAEVMVPFTQTPSNVATRFLDYSPAGFVTAIVRASYTGSQKRFAEDITKPLTGAALVWLGYDLARRGLATGASPTSMSDVSQWELEGKAPNSVLIGDRWENVARVGPPGMLIALGAQFAKIAEQDATLGQQIGAAAGSAGRVVTDQSMLRGVSSGIQAINDPVRAGGNLTEGLARSIVPTAVGRVAEAMDDRQRDPDGILEAIQSRIPGLREELPERLNAFGEPLEFTAGDRLGILFDPFHGRRVNPDPVVQELARLGVAVGKPPRSRTVDGKRVEYSADDRRELLLTLGQMRAKLIATVMASPAYFKASDEVKRDMLERVLSRSSRAVYARDDSARKARPPAMAAK